MSLKKLMGSYYTPSHIAEFIVERVISKLSEKTLNILEPSAGDGAFIRALSKYMSLTNTNVERLLAVEIAMGEANKISENISLKGLEVICTDFLEFQAELPDASFNLVIGNPPYVKRNYLSDQQLELCADIHAQFSELSKSTIKNIWSSFLIRSISLLAEDGVLALVLPSELLQVKYAKELRELLLKHFERIEIFTFNELLFKECKGQDTLILIAEKKSKVHGLFFCNIKSQEELNSKSIELKLNEHKAIHSLKWTSHTLTSSERLLIERLAKNIPKINDVITSKPGIVTAANAFFILNKSNVEKYCFEKYAKPIIQNSSFIGNNVSFSRESFFLLAESEVPCFLLDFNNINTEREEGVTEYFLQGTKEGLPSRYKMRSRKNWFQVPNIGIPAPALFLRRCHGYPKIIKNEANVLATDTAYLVYPREGYQINSIIFSFYNSLTLVLAELYGRYYGGGVLELTPHEFKGLPIPYMQISELEFEDFSESFSNIKLIEDICLKYDERILRNSFPKITNRQLKKLQDIRKKLSARRQRL